MVKTLYVMFIILMIIIGPVLPIWALNTLFELHIPFAISTWMASFILLLAIHKSDRS